MNKDLSKLVQEIEKRFKRKGMQEGTRARGVWKVECRDVNGKLKWEENFENLVVNEGLQKLLDDTLLGGTQTTTWYVGLTDGTPTVAAGDTLASHVGWVEIADYTGNRQAYVGVRTNQTVSNTASRASFTMNATTTVGGAFLASAATGTVGVLFSAGAFAEGDRSVVSSDVLNVLYEVTQSAS